MYGVLALLLACLAGAHGFSTCSLCSAIPDRTYCCFGSGDSNYCCTAEEYYKGGFMNNQTMSILIAVGVLILVIIAVCICCCCCSCCPCYKRRREGAVYNSVVRPGPPAYQPGTASYYNAQYPQQLPSNPYLVQNASAPTYNITPQ